MNLKLPPWTVWAIHATNRHYLMKAIILYDPQSWISCIKFPGSQLFSKELFSQSSVSPTSLTGLLLLKKIRIWSMSLWIPDLFVIILAFLVFPSQHQVYWRVYCKREILWFITLLARNSFFKKKLFIRFLNKNTKPEQIYHNYTAIRRGYTEVYKWYNEDQISN